MSKNKTLSDAKSAKNDEFYTQYADIQKEVNAYLDYNPNTFRANVTTSRQVGSQGLTNDNLIAITTDSRHRSYVINMNRGIWTADNKLGSDWRYAHEAGHLMGLDDDYTDQNGPNPGHEGHMMAVRYGDVDVHEAMDIIRF